MKSTALSVRAIFLLLLTSFQISFAANLQQQAHEQYVGRKYREAANTSLAILADTASPERNRRFAIQMLGTIYENHLFKFDSAAYWYEQFVTKYATGVQRNFYREKIRFLRGLGNKEKKGYSLIQKGTYATDKPNDQIALLEKGMSIAPALSNREAVLLQLCDKAFEAGRYGKARSALLRLRELNPALVSGELRKRFQQVQTSWRNSIIARVCWGIVAVLLAAVLFTTPYRRMPRKAWRMLIPLYATCIPLAIALVCCYFFFIRAKVHNPFPDPAIIVAAFILLAIASWIFLARFSLLHRIGGRAAIAVLPICSLLLAAASCFLFVYHQPQGVVILGEFGERYVHWIKNTPTQGSLNEKKKRNALERPDSAH